MIIGVFFLLQKLSELIHHFSFMFHQRMSVAIKSDRWKFMTEDLRERFYVHSYLQSPRCEGVPQRMKAAMRNVQPFQQERKASLIGPYRHRIFAVRYDVYRAAFFLSSLSGFMSCFGRGIVLMDDSVLGLSVMRQKSPSESLP